MKKNKVIEEYLQEMRKKGAKAFSEKYKGTEYAKEFSRKGVEARQNKTKKKAVDNSK